jgi:hypothetical protein
MAGIFVPPEFQAAILRELFSSYMTHFTPVNLSPHPPTPITELRRQHAATFNAYRERE